MKISLELQFWNLPKKLNSKKYFLVVSISLLLIVSFSIPTFSQVGLPKAKPEIPKTPKPVEIITFSDLEVICNLPDADIYLDDKLVGRTNREGRLTKPKKLKIGQYKIKINHQEYESHIEEVKVASSRPTIIKAELIPTFGIVILSGIENLKKLEIKLDDILIQKNIFEIDQENKTIKLKIPLGEHKIKILCEGYLPQEETFLVVAKEPKILPILLKPELSFLTIKSTPRTQVYVNEVNSGIISKNGELKVINLVPNQEYKIKLELDGYETKEVTTKIEAKKENLVQTELLPLPASVAFEDNFLAGLTLWDAPKDWKTEKALLIVKGQGMGFPKKKRYRDCEIVFGLQLLSNKGAAWVVRAKDNNNYYLFYLTGTDSPFPNELRTYICIEGKINLNEPVQVQKVRVPINTQDYYRIYITVVGNLIKHFLQSNKTGEKVSIGSFVDADNLFPLGNIGFTTLDMDNFQVNGFVIKPTELSK